MKYFLSSAVLFFAFAVHAQSKTIKGVHGFVFDHLDFHNRILRNWTDQASESIPQVYAGAKTLHHFSHQISERGRSYSLFVYTKNNDEKLVHLEGLLVINNQKTAYSFKTISEPKRLLETLSLIHESVVKTNFSAVD